MLNWNMNNVASYSATGTNGAKYEARNIWFGRYNWWLYVDGKFHSYRSALDDIKAIAQVLDMQLDKYVAEEH